MKGIGYTGCMSGRMQRVLEDIHARLSRELRISCRESFDYEKALASVIPQIPELIEQTVTQADAQILTREELQELLARFSADVMALQADTIRSRRSTKKPRRVHDTV